jgi:mRNA interferase MazF
VGKFVKGDVVVTPFPFTDLSASKKRPALVIATLLGDDVVLCAITSQGVADDYAVALQDADFETGSSRQESNIRPNRLFTADGNVILCRAGKLSDSKLQKVKAKIVEIVNS